jgi:hypothetical protein
MALKKIIVSNEYTIYTLCARVGEVVSGVTVTLLDQDDRIGQNVYRFETLTHEVDVTHGFTDGYNSNIAVLIPKVHPDECIAPMRALSLNEAVEMIRKELMVGLPDPNLETTERVSREESFLVDYFENPPR